MIIYASKYGSVREYVGWIQDQGASVDGADGETSAGVATPAGGSPFTSYDVGRDLKGAVAALAASDTSEPIVIISPVYAGQIHRKVRGFIENNIELLRRHPVALGLTSLYQGDRAREELMNVFPGVIVSHASQQFLIGGRIRPDELPFIVRGIVKKVAGTSEEIDTLDRDVLNEIAGWLQENG